MILYSILLKKKLKEGAFSELFPPLAEGFHAAHGLSER